MTNRTKQLEAQAEVSRRLVEAKANYLSSMEGGTCSETHSLASAKTLATFLPNGALRDLAFSALLAIRDNTPNRHLVEGLLADALANTRIVGE